jgi:rubrerythrin
MSIVFSNRELINIAIEIEKRGITFYDIMARSADNEVVRGLFQDLIGMERHHIEVFQGMLDEADRQQPVEKGTEDYVGYLRALLDNAVFTDDLISSEMATRADSDVRALELGMMAEKDSILFYYQMKDIMPEPTHLIDTVIAEEKSHLRQLAAMKKDMTST